MRLIILAISLLSFIQPAKASEIDSFIPRYEKFPDGLAVISKEVDQRIGFAIEHANSVSSCSLTALETFLAVELIRPFYGRIEGFANTSETVPRYHVPFSDSIYQNLPSFNFLVLYVGEGIVGFGTVIHDGKLLIGTDKFGHFIDEGHWFYRSLKADGSNLDQILHDNEMSEEGINGLLLGGVKSYADMVANYNGMRFWSDLLIPKFQDSKPYTKCENNQWVQIRHFNFTDYIDPAWDEGINCCSYRTVEFEHAVLSTIDTLEAKMKRKLQCPLWPEECAKAVKKYGPIASKLLNPKCLSAAQGLDKI